MLAPGTLLGPYEIVSPIGAGGMGEVYRARDTRLDRTVAVKVLSERLSASPDARERFEREARTISQLSHPHICALHDIGEAPAADGPITYLVMEYLEGETLESRLAKGPLPPDEVRRHGIEIAGALDRAHRAGIVHRDLKPGNVMLTKSGVKLLDFGLAKAFAPAGPLERASSLPTTGPDLTKDGAIVGTLSYMSPEQLQGKQADARADIFALGAVLYEMATGKRAFSGANQASVITAIMSAAVPRVSSAAPSSPRSFDRLVTTCLAKDPDERWQSARDVELQLASLEE
ncbi:MAG TPA: serine/threonine-protein kinase, partial [Thermoanaerobaculia bacterium]|nr:serine/threonine-protein kinase [Thermoanaerobaculia bacterium]